MTELASEFLELSPEYQSAIAYAQDQHNLSIKSLQKLAGGKSGAVLYLVSVTYHETGNLRHLVLKLDQAEQLEEVELHRSALDSAPKEFAEQHIATVALEPIQHEGAICIFYGIAGSSLQRFKPIASFTSLRQLELIYRTICLGLLEGWNAGMDFETQVTPRAMLEHWLGERIQPGESRLETFLQETGLDPEIPGLIFSGRIFPNPLAYARQDALWGGTRPLDVARGFKHGDFNTRNVLVKFSQSGEDLEDYSLIDFDHFQTGAYLFFDNLYMEFAYLLQLSQQVPQNEWTEFVIALADSDIPEPLHVPAQLTGPCTVINAARKAFDEWVESNHPDLLDDLWGQYRLAAAAVGTNFANKSAVPPEGKLAALTYAAAHLNRFCDMFGVPRPMQAAAVHLDAQAAPAGDAPAAPAAAASGWTAGQSNLPAEPTPFVGRKQELQDIADLLDSPGCRLLTLLGPGGMGKTRLSQKAAAEYLERTHHGVCWVPLAPLGSADNLVSAIADALGFAFYSEEDLKGQLLDYLREKELLLVLDNFEHVVAGADLVGEILDAAAGVKVLVTSRERLNLLSETVFEVGGMLFAEAGDQGFDDSEAVQVFVNAARRVSPDYTLAESDRPAVARICQIVGGMPLGLVLAASFVRMLDVEEIATEIENSRDFLETSMRDMPERHRSMRAVFESSWNLLTAEQQQAVMRLAGFRGGFTRDAARQVAGTGLAVLTTLTDSSLLRRISPDRFDMHEMLRQFVIEKLADNPALEDETRDKHAAYYVAFLHAREPEWKGAQIRAALDAIQTELENIKMAWGRAVERLMTDGLRQSLLSLDKFFFVRNYFEDAAESFGSAADAVGAADQEADRVLLWQLRSMQTFYMWANASDRDQVAALVRETLDAVHSAHAEREMGMVYTLLIRRATSFMTAEQVKELYASHLPMARETGDPYQIMWALGSYGGFLFMELDDPDEAEKQLEEAVQVGEQIGERSMMTFALTTLGNIARARQDYEHAADLYARSRRICEEIGNRAVGATNLLNLGEVDAAQGQYDEARQRFEECLAVWRDLGERLRTAETLVALGDAAARSGDADAARAALEEGQALAHDQGDADLEARAAEVLGSL